MSVDERELAELADLWRAQPLPSRAWTREEIARRVRAKARQHDRAIFWRNVREAVAGALLIGTMGWTSWLAPGWLPKLGALVGVASVICVLGRLVRARREHPSARQDLPLVDWLETEARKIEAEIELLRSVRRWYVAPLFAGTAVWGGILVSLGLASLPMPRARLALALALVVLMVGVIFSAVGWAVWKLNQFGIARYLQPYALELREALREARTGTEESNR
jgi:hypothetical protein